MSVIRASIAIAILVSLILVSSWTLAPANGAAPSCKVQQDGNTWLCVTPGAFCPKAAHKRYGYSRGNMIRYRCTWYPASRQLHWKNAAIKPAVCPTPTVTVTVTPPTEPPMDTP